MTVTYNNILKQYYKSNSDLFEQAASEIEKREGYGLSSLYKLNLTKDKDGHYSDYTTQEISMYLMNVIEPKKQYKNKDDAKAAFIYTAINGMIEQAGNHIGHTRYTLDSNAQDQLAKNLSVAYDNFERNHAINLGSRELHEIMTISNIKSFGFEAGTIIGEQFVRSINNPQNTDINQAKVLVSLPRHPVDNFISNIPVISSIIRTICRTNLVSNLLFNYAPDFAESFLNPRITRYGFKDNSVSVENLTNMLGFSYIGKQASFHGLESRLKEKRVTPDDKEFLNKYKNVADLNKALIEEQQKFSNDYSGRTGKAQYDMGIGETRRKLKELIEQYDPLNYAPANPSATKRVTRSMDMSNNNSHYL
jgi:hypothetical protein